MKKTVWTKQHENVLKELNEKGRYIARKEFILNDLEEHAELVLEVYDWFVNKMLKKYPKPADVTYPVWVSLSNEGTMMQSDNTVILELEIEESIIMPVNISKWGMIMNYAYIPADAQDDTRHKQMLKDYNTTDAKAYMSQFYPQIKRGIIESWDRLFDDRIVINNTMAYGTLWELRKEWIKNIVQ